MMATKPPRAEILSEALLLEQLSSEWNVAHAAAFCLLSESAIYRSDCPRIEKEGFRGATDRSMIRFVPAKVREWNAGRTKAAAA